MGEIKEKVFGEIVYYLAHGQFEDAGIAIESRIEALEKRVFPAEPEKEEPVPTGKDNKLAGELEPGDVIKVSYSNDYAIFSHCIPGWIYGYAIPNGKLCPFYPSQVIFQFRPKFPKEN